MSSPFEDKVWKYIAEHRPLKLFFLAISGIGIVGSAVKTIEPAWTEGARMATRYLAEEPSAEIREKYGCAYQTGQSYWTLSRFVITSRGQPKPDINFANYALQTIRLCERLHQFTPVVTDIPTKLLDGTASPEEIQQHFVNATNNWNEFQAHLATKDRQALALLRIGSEFETARVGLGNFRNDDPKAFEGPLSKNLQEGVKRVTRLHEEAQSNFPYRLPELKLATTSAAALLNSIVAADSRFAKYFKGDA